MRAAAYIRVSTETQADKGLGADIQREQIERFCQDSGWELVAVYEDPGVSGASMPAERPALWKLMKAAEAGAFEKVVIARLDRLARDLFIQELIRRDLRGMKVAVVSIAEPYSDDEDTGQMITQIIGAVAEYDKKKIVRRLQNGRKAKRQRGGYMGGPTVPLGLRVQGEGREADLVPDEQAPVVQRIFREYARGYSMKTMADRLQAAGVATKAGGEWTQQQVANVLHNDLYVMKGLVSEPEFDRCQQQAESKRRGYPGHQKQAVTLE